jgi:hypothetical protein
MERRHPAGIERASVQITSQPLANEAALRRLRDVCRQDAGAPSPQFII